MKSNVEIFKLFKNFERDKLISEFGVESKKFLGTGPLFHKKIDFENLIYFRRHEIIWLNKTDGKWLSILQSSDSGWVRLPAIEE